MSWPESYGHCVQVAAPSLEDMIHVCLDDRQSAVGARAVQTCGERALEKVCTARYLFCW